MPLVKYDTADGWTVGADTDAGNFGASVTGLETHDRGGVRGFVAAGEGSLEATFQELQAEAAG